MVHPSAIVMEPNAVSVLGSKPMETRILPQEILSFQLEADKYTNNDNSDKITAALKFCMKCLEGVEKRTCTRA